MTHKFALFLSTCLMAGTLAACSQSAEPTKSEIIIDDPTVPHAMLPDNVTPTEYRIDMVINPDDDAFKGVVEIDVEIDQPTTRIWLHGKEMTVTDAVAKLPDGTDMPLTFSELSVEEAPSGVAHLTTDTPIPAGTATLRMPYTTPFNLALNSAYKVEREGEAYIVTQMQVYGAREAYPSFDEPRFKTPITMSISAPNEDVVVANTPVESTEDAGGGWTKHNFQTSRPLPTYLTAFAVGPYDVAVHADLPPTDLRDRPVPLRGIGAKGTEAQFAYGLENTQGILEVMEDYFGIPYPYEKLDIIAAPEYAFGAMENPGAIVYLEYLMLLDENAPLSQKRAYARVHSHELAHQWFGNLVTPYWWEDAWLNEAFATWMGNKAIDIWKPEGNFANNTLNAALGAMNLDALASTRPIRQPLDRTENVLNQFDAITYRKGGGVLDMFEAYLGEDKFRDGVRLHMKRYEDGVATADKFFQSIADGSGNPDVVDAMKSFVDQPGLPLVSGEMVCEKDETTVYLEQSRYAPLGSQIKQGQSWQIPVCATFGYGNDTTTRCALIKDKSTELVSERTDRCADWVTLNANGSGYYRFSLDTNGWNDLLENVDALNTREVLTMQDSLEAAFRAGEVEPAVYLKGMEVLADHPEYDVVQGTDDLVAWMYDYLPKDSRPDLGRWVNDMYADRYKASAGQDTVDGNLLAPTLASRLLFVAKDEALRAEFAANGAAYLGLDSAADKSAVASNMLTNALAMAMIERGEDAVDLLLNMVKSGTAREKSSALSALGAVKDRAIYERLRNVLLTDGKTMTGRQASSLLYGLMASDDFGDDTWDWFKANFDQFVTDRLPAVRKGSTPNYSRGCSQAERDEVEAFFESKSDIIPGYELKLAQNLESIELCAARKSDIVPDLVKALAAR